MGQLIMLVQTATYRRSRELARADKYRRIAKAVAAIAEGWELKACGIAIRAGYVGFVIRGHNEGAPKEAVRYCRAARRYRQAEARIYDLAQSVENRARGSRIIDVSLQPKGAA